MEESLVLNSPQGLFLLITMNFKLRFFFEVRQRDQVPAYRT